MADRSTHADMIRAAPLRHAVLIAVPLLVAAAQLGNSAFGNLPFALSIPLAVVLVGFTGLLAQYNLARFRRRTLEQRWIGRLRHP